jgi:flagellar FliJ protein
MSRRFPLAGLLRLQQLHEDAAAIQLAAANARSTATRSRQKAARLQLAEMPSEVVNAAALNSVAAARSSSRSMLAELAAVSAENQVRTEQAQAAFNEARSQSVRLQKLETKHQARVVAEELHTEQTAIDEIASGAWHRGRGGAGANPAGANGGAKP